MTSLAQQFQAHADYQPDALAVDAGRRLIVDALSPILGTEHIPLRDALGRVLADSVISPIDVPPHDNSAMDGYGLRGADLAADGPTRLELVGTALAGQPCAARVGPGQAVRIMTGARLPAGVDTVVMQEAAHAEGGRVTLAPGQRAGHNIRRAGEDLHAGQVALAAGRQIRPAELGLVASLGISEVAVRRRLRVAFFSTGDEVATPGGGARDGQIYDSNRYTLCGMLTRLGCDAIDIGVVRDDPDALETTLREAASVADVVITSGGVSVGDADFTRAMMARLGEVLFWKIAMKPGRPLAFGRLGRDDRAAWMFGLPGNPVAAMVSFYQFVQPALLKLAGVDPLPATPLLQVPCATALRKPAGRTEFLRGVLYPEGGQWRVRTTGAQGSGILSSMADANCFIVLGPQQTAVAAGEPVSVQVLDGLV